MPSPVPLSLPLPSDICSLLGSTVLSADSKSSHFRSTKGSTFSLPLQHPVYSSHCSGAGPRVVGPRALRSPQQHQGGHTGHSLSRWLGPAGGGAHALAFPAAPTGAHGEAELHEEQRSHLALSADLCGTDDGGEAAGSKGLQFYRGLQEKSREEHRGDSASGGNMSTEPDRAGLPGAR